MNTPTFYDVDKVEVRTTSNAMHGCLDAIHFITRIMTHTSLGSCTKCIPAINFKCEMASSTITEKGL